MTVPDGYIVGLDRGDYNKSQRLHGHLYKGDFYEHEPMCRYAWNRKQYGWSIWRGHRGLGICKICLRRAERGLPPVPNPWGEES